MPEDKQEEKEYNKWKSRKFVVALIVIAIGTAYSFYFNGMDAEFAGFLVTVGLSYAGGNVMSKKYIMENKGAN